jgi:hypothetical protein
VTLARQEPADLHEIAVHQERAAVFERDVPGGAAHAGAILVDTPVVRRG